MMAAALALLVAAPPPPGGAPPRETTRSANRVEPAAAAAPGAAAEGLGSGPGLSGIELFPRPRLGAPRAGGPFQGRVMLGASGGTLAGDAVVVALAYGTFRLFTSGAVSPTAAHFRYAGIGLLTATVILPPLGAALGGGWAGRGARAGGSGAPSSCRCSASRSRSPRATSPRRPSGPSCRCSSPPWRR